jgi:hypothetical protein
MTPIKSSWKLFILIFILPAVVLFAYMAWQFEQATSQNERHTYSSTETPAAQGTMSHGNYWAEIDPVPDIRLVQAENVTILGTTNLPPGENITIDFFASSMHPSPEVYYPDLHFIAFAEVKLGAGGTNTWSLTIQPQRFPKPDTYQILVSDQGGYSIGSRTVVVNP